MYDIIKKISDMTNLSGNRVGIFCLYGLGDTYIICSFMAAFMRQKGKMPIIIAPENHSDIIDMFALEKCLIKSHNIVMDLRQFIQDNEFDNIINGHIGKFIKGDIWAAKLEFINENQIPQTFNLFLYRKYVLQLDASAYLSFPKFLNRINYSYYIQKYELVPNKTVLLCPEANTAHELSPDFWNCIGKVLSLLGNKIVVNAVKNKEKYIFPIVEFPMRDAIGFVELCGTMIAHRSGFCDVVSSAQAKKIVIYNDINLYNSWSLKKMGLCDDEQPMIMGNL